MADYADEILFKDGKAEVFDNGVGRDGRSEGFPSGGGSEGLALGERSPARVGEGQVLDLEKQFLAGSRASGGILRFHNLYVLAEYLDGATYALNLEHIYIVVDWIFEYRDYDPLPMVLPKEKYPWLGKYTY